MDNEKIGQEYESSVSVQQVLETISDTVLQIVLFQVEAKENQSHLVNLNMKPLLESMRYLVDLARKKTEKWPGKEEEKNKKNMFRACDTMTKAMDTIEKSMQILEKDKYHKKAKDDLLWAARTVVQCTVTLLQIADNYDIRKIINGAKASEEEQNKIIELEDMSGLPELIRKYIFEVVNLAKTVESRVNYIPDPIIAKKFREANKVVTELPEPLIQMHVTGKTQDNEQMLQTAKEHDKKLKDAYKQLIKLAKLSSQEMFAGIDLDLNPLDDDDPNKRLQTQDVTLNDLAKKLQTHLENNSPQKVLQTIALIQDKANEQLRLGKEAEMSETDPNKRDILHAAASNLANAIKGLVDNAKGYAENPVEEKKKKVFQAIDSVLNASDNMKKAQAMPDHFDKAAENVSLMLANLGDLVRFGNEKEAVEVVKKVIGGIQDQVKQAQQVKFERGPNQKKAMQIAVEQMKPILSGLLNSTKGVLSNKSGQDAPKFLKAFDVALQNAEDYSKKIESLTHPEKSVEVCETPSEKLLGVARKVDNAIDELWNAGTEDIVPKYKDLSAVVGEEILMAKNMGHPQEAQKLQKALEGLLNPIKNYAKDPKNPKNQKELDYALSNIQNAQQELLGKALTPKEVAFNSGIGLKKHGADLIDAIKAGDTRRAGKLLDEVQRDLLSQAKALRSIPVEGDQAKELEKLAQQQEDIAKKLPLEVEKALKTKNVTPVSSLIEKANDNSQKIIDALTPDVEMDMIHHANKLNNAMNLLKASKEVGDDQTAQFALDEILDLLKGDDILCSMLAGKTFNKKLKQTLLDCGQDIANILSSMAEANGKLSNLDLIKLGEMLTKIKKLNDLILNSTGDPVEKIAQIGEQIDNLVDTIEFPITQENQGALTSIVDGLEEQILLANLVAEQYPERKEHLDQAIEKAKRHLEVLRPAVIDVTNDLNDKNAQKRLQNILAETKDVNRDIVDASQPPHWERVIKNCGSLSKNLPLLSDSIKNGNKSNALSLLESVSNKMKAQGALVLGGSKKVANEKLRKELQEAGADQEIMGKGFFELGKNRIDGVDWSFTAKFNSTYNRAVKLNEAILALAKKALSGVNDELEEIDESPQENTANQLGVISLKVRKAAQELQVDDTPKGQMFGCAKELGKLLETLSNAAKSGDKAEMIRATKEISSNVQKVLSLSKSVNCNQNDKDQIISFALNAKNFGVQLKILTAVKASINETDKTAENQLVSCAQQLADNVMNCVKMTDIASLKK